MFAFALDSPYSTLLHFPRLDHIPSSGSPIVRIPSMISIREGAEGLWSIRGRVHTFVVHCARQIAKDMLCSLPVSQARVRVESGKNSGRIGNVRPCGECQVHEGANKGDIGVLGHL